MRLDEPGANHPSGALVAYDFNAILKGGKPVRSSFSRQARARRSRRSTRPTICCGSNCSRMFPASCSPCARQPDGRWAADRMNLPGNSTVQMLAGADKRDELLVTVENFITPTSLVRVSPDRRGNHVQSLPAQFDASNMAVSQYFATSKDGTRCRISWSARRI